MALSIYKFYFNGTQSINKWAKYIFLTALTAVSLSYISLLLSVITIYQIQYGSYIFIIIAVLAQYLLVLLRLISSFTDSQFSISAKKIYFHISNIVLILLTATIAAISDYLLLRTWCLCFSAFCAIMYIIGYSHLAYCFNHNLFLLVLSQRSTVIKTDTNKDHADMNIRQKQMLQIVVKQTLLSCMVLVSVLLFVIFVIITVPIYSIAKLNENQLSVLFEMLYWSGAFMYNGVLFCQYLTFSVNVKCYERICLKCHMKCDDFLSICCSKAYVCDNDICFICLFRVSLVFCCIVFF